MDDGVVIFVRWRCDIDMEFIRKNAEKRQAEKEALSGTKMDLLLFNCLLVITPSGLCY